MQASLGQTQDIQSGMPGQLILEERTKWQSGRQPAAERVALLNGAAQRKNNAIFKVSVCGLQGAGDKRRQGRGYCIA